MQWWILRISRGSQVNAWLTPASDLMRFFSACPETVLGQTREWQIMKQRCKWQRQEGKTQNLNRWETRSERVRSQGVLPTHPPVFGVNQLITEAGRVTNMAETEGQVGFTWSPLQSWWVWPLSISVVGELSKRSCPKNNSTCMHACPQDLKCATAALKFSCTTASMVSLFQVKMRTVNRIAGCKQHPRQGMSYFSSVSL